MPAQDEPAPPVTPVPAATVMVLRDRPCGLEVLMVERTRKADFAGGALLFPGGKVDAADHRVIAAGRCAMPDGTPDDLRALRIAGVREVFEEANILFARPAGSPDIISTARAREISIRHRRALLDNKITLFDIAEAEDLQIAGDRLTPFAHWITPTGGRKRFDTHFLVARAPPGQVALHDGWETMETVWIKPADAISDGEAGRRRVVFPTRMNLCRVAQSSTAEAAVAQAARTPVVTVLPEVRMVAGGRRIRIPLEAGYGVSEMIVDYPASDQPPLPLTLPTAPTAKET